MVLRRPQSQRLPLLVPNDPPPLPSLPLPSPPPCTITSLPLEQIKPHPPHLHLQGAPPSLVPLSRTPHGWVGGWVGVRGVSWLARALITNRSKTVKSEVETDTDLHCKSHKTCSAHIPCTYASLSCVREHCITKVHNVKSWMFAILRLQKINGNENKCLFCVTFS